MDRGAYRDQAVPRSLQKKRVKVLVKLFTFQDESTCTGALVAAIAEREIIFVATCDGPEGISYRWNRPYLDKEGR